MDRKKITVKDYYEEAALPHEENENQFESTEALQSGCDQLPEFESSRSTLAEDDDEFLEDESEIITQSCQLTNPGLAYVSSSSTDTFIDERRNRPKPSLVARPVYRYIRGSLMPYKPNSNPAGLPEVGRLMRVSVDTRQRSKYQQGAGVDIDAQSAVGSSHSSSSDSRRTSVFEGIHSYRVSGMYESNEDSEQEAKAKHAMSHKEDTVHKYDRKKKEALQIIYGYNIMELGRESYDSQEDGQGSGQISEMEDLDVSEEALNYPQEEDKSRNEVEGMMEEKDVAMNYEEDNSEPSVSFEADESFDSPVEAIFDENER
ncbi:hypothetical protein SK128_007616, partial [Halocaridina rubra]